MTVFRVISKSSLCNPLWVPIFWTFFCVHCTLLITYFYGRSLPCTSLCFHWVIWNQLLHIIIIASFFFCVFLRINDTLTEYDEESLTSKQLMNCDIEPMREIILNSNLINVFKGPKTEKKLKQSILIVKSWSVIVLVPRRFLWLL